MFSLQPQLFRSNAMANRNSSAHIFALSLVKNLRSPKSFFGRPKPPHLDGVTQAQMDPPLRGNPLRCLSALFPKGFLQNQGLSRGSTGSGSDSRNSFRRGDADLLRFPLDPNPNNNVIERLNQEIRRRTRVVGGQTETLP